MANFWTVDYEKRVGGEHENDFKVFTDEADAEAFATEHYSYVYKSDSDGNEVKYEAT